MKLCTFSHGGATRVGVVTDDGSRRSRRCRARAAARADGAARGRRRRAPRRGERRDAREEPARARRGAPRAADPAPAEVPRDRPQLRRPRRRGRARGAEAPDRLQQAVHLRRRPARSGAHAARLVGARLRGRARLRDRAALPPRAARARPRGDRRLPGRERRDRARLAAPHPDLDDGQVLRHARPARAVAHHGRRGRRPARPAPAHLGERRAAPGLEHEAADLRLLRPGRAPLDGLHARARRRRRDGHARRRRHRDEAAEAAPGRRRDARRDRRPRRAREHRDPRARGRPTCIPVRACAGDDGAPAHRRPPAPGAAALRELAARARHPRRRRAGAARVVGRGGAGA